MIRLLVDGVVFQGRENPVGRLWRSVLPFLTSDNRFEVFLLDRGSAPELDGVIFVPFPRYHLENSAADSMLVQKLCDHYDIDVFTTTDFTSPLATPMVLLIHDMSAELFSAERSSRMLHEKQLSVAFAQRFVCVSHATREDVLRFYPEVPPTRLSVAHCGVDPGIFFQRSEEQVSHFRSQHKIDGPYILIKEGGYSGAGQGYAEMFFEWYSRLDTPEFSILCLDENKKIMSKYSNKLGSSVRCCEDIFSDEDLSRAFTSATALVYFSLYEGFPNTIIDAMACGCPVIANRQDVLVEVAGAAAIYVDDVSGGEMGKALECLTDVGSRKLFRKKSLDLAATYRWAGFAQTLTNQILETVQESREGLFDQFFAEWKRLREVQASVDYVKN